MTTLPITDDSRVTLDPASGAILTWFDVVPPAPAKGPVRPAEIARELLDENRELFAWSAEAGDVVDDRVIDGVDAHSARFRQELDGVPVDASEILVNMHADGTVHSIYNGYHYDIPADLSTKPSVTARKATSVVEALVKALDGHELTRPELIVYRFELPHNHPPKRPVDESVVRRALAVAATAALETGDRPLVGNHYLAWDIRVVSSQPSGEWRVLVDAHTGAVLSVIDLAQYATGAGRVFDPNPVVTGGNATLAPNTAAATLDTMTTAVVVDHLNAADGAGNFHLDGSFVTMEEFEAPTFSEPTNSLGDFIFSTSNRAFLDVMCYFHLDRFQTYVQSVLGLSNVANFAVGVDAQGLSGADNSHYLPATKRIAFGEGGGVPDDQDAMVILHEYGHAIQDNSVPGFANPVSGVGEGFGDFLAAVYYDDKHTNPSATRGWMMSWDARGGWGGRRYDRTYHFDDAQYTGETDNHITGELWCSTLFELYRKLGGDSFYPSVRAAARDLAIRLHLQANFLVPTTSTAAQMGQQIEAADSNLSGFNGLANGLHRKVVYDTFARRHLGQYPAKAVDVYVNDGREGGYGSTSGQDLFGEVLWLDNYWETQDIWVRPTPYASAAAQQAGGPGDHVEPPVGSTAYLYVRVKNRGTNAAGSGPVTVRAFDSDPGIGLVWPDNWTEMDASAANPVANVLPGPANGAVVGPFTWTPHEVGHECVLVILECANDKAVTQVLAANAHVRHSDLVPFDNNIAQRNLAPTSAKGKMTRGFWLQNPDEIVREVELHFASTLPKGWRWLTGLANPESIRMAPLERRWIDLVIDQHEGAAVTEFDDPGRLVVTGTIEGRLIGGMTFYVAPPSAFGGPHRHDDDDERCDLDDVRNAACRLDIPWAECDLDGELELRVRFKRRC